MSQSAIYEGWVAHRRHGETPHGFRYRTWMALIDLSELPGAFAAHPLWSARRPAPVRFRESDFLREGEPSSRPLAERAKDLVQARLGDRPGGPVRVLAAPRAFGVGFNPVSFLYLYGEDGVTVEALIAEVTNTPWGERHSYVVAASPGSEGVVEARLSKRLHVSPFMPIEQAYELRVGAPGDTLRIGIASETHGRRSFDAMLSLRRRPLRRLEMSALLLRHPPATVATLARIYWHGLRLWRKGAKHHPHPRSSDRELETAP